MRFEETLLDNFIEIGGEKYSPLHLGDFIKLEYYKNNIFEAIAKKDSKIFLESLKNIIFLQTKKELDTKRNPVEILLDFFQIINKNVIKAKAVFLIPPPKKSNKEEIKIRWDYDGRFFSQWIDLLAKNYAWKLEDILNLNVNTAVYLIQEILVNQQLEKEWTYSLSELAYHYDSNSKKSIFQPLDRPYWMDEKMDVEINKPVKIRKDFFPQGVTNASGIPVPNEIKKSENTPE